MAGVSLQFWDDATWILTSAFIIFTMQSGFGLLEAGTVGSRCEVNIMMKNAIDILFGGVSYWMFGYGLAFGQEAGSNGFVGVGYWCVDTDPTDPSMGFLFSNFVFQLSFVSTATTIVSGAMAERTKMTSYVIFSFLNTFIFSIPAHWVWAKIGWLKVMGAIDIAGSGTVHMLGAVSGLVATIMLKPRTGRYDNGDEPLPMGNPANAIVGMFMLWWGWLAFNCGSTFGVSDGKWMNAAKSATTTLNSAMGGGTVGLLSSYFMKHGKYEVSWMVMSVLSGLVAVTASCAVVKPYEALIIGAVSGALTLLSARALDKLRIDDPVNAVAIHGVSGLWGLIATGLFADMDPILNITMGRRGLFHGGGFYLLGVQCLMALAIIVWTVVTTTIVLTFIRLTYGLRMSEEEELLGADITEHGVGEVRPNVITRPETTNTTRPPTISPVDKVSQDRVFYRDFFPNARFKGQDSLTSKKKPDLFTITETEEEAKSYHNSDRV